jgi:biopolymer transport protein ExbD
MQMKTKGEADVNITSLIDCLMQCIIFFMVIMSANYIYGVAIKFPQTGGTPPKGPVEKRISVYVKQDYLECGKDGEHVVIQDGTLMLNDEEIALVTSVNLAPGASRDTIWAKERLRGFGYLQAKMKKLITEEGYKKDQLMIRGDIKTYHKKIMAVIDAGKSDSIDAFSLVPPTQ